MLSMKAPDFWIEGGPLSDLMAPLGWAWAAGSGFRGRGVVPYKASVPVVCVGNLVAGGAGKTPVALSIAQHLEGAAFLSTGYGGREAGPVLVDRRHHDHSQVGDEPLLLSEAAPCWVAKDRIAGAKAAAAAGATCIIMDDGFQNPSLHKDVSLVVVDGHVGFGSGRCIPAGPLREPVARGLQRASAVVIIGDDRKGIRRQVGHLPVLRAHLEPEAEAEGLAGQPVVAFAGIGRPEKFFHTLDRLGAHIAEAYAFPDHHPYHPNEIADLIARATIHSCMLITTSKDLVRIPAHLRSEVAVLQISVAWSDEEALMRVLAPALADMPL